MKKITKLIVFFLFSIFFFQNVNAQIYEGTTYQAVIRNSSNALITNSVVGVKISIMQFTSTGNVVFSESHTPTTNANGLVTFVIGEGTALIGDYFNISWEKGPYFIETSIDPTGGGNYTISGISQINTVPYAQFSENAVFATQSGDSWKRSGNIVDATTDFIGSLNNADVNFLRNNLRAGKISATNTYLGVGAGEFNVKGGNVAIGANALNKGGGGGSIGNLNTAVGYDSYPNNVEGYGNAAFGNNSLLDNTHGYYNAAIGASALHTLTLGNRNTGLGYLSLVGLTTGSGNIGIGESASVPLPTGDNQLSIGNVIYGTGMGNIGTGKIGIGIVNPAEKLEVSGKTKTTQLQVTTNAVLNRILTSDASGNATWQEPAPSPSVNTGLQTRRISTQVIASSTDTKILYNFEQTDDANAHNTTTGDWTIPSTGFYHIYATAMFTTVIPAGTYVKMMIYKNGTIFKSQVRVIGYASSIENFEITSDLKLNANDTISIYINQGSGASATIGGQPDAVHFSGFRVY